jgi:hypothetical protein
VQYRLGLIEVSSGPCGREYVVEVCCVLLSPDVWCIFTCRALVRLNVGHCPASILGVFTPQATYGASTGLPADIHSVRVVGSVYGSGQCSNNIWIVTSDYNIIQRYSEQHHDANTEVRVVPGRMLRGWRGRPHTLLRNRRRGGNDERKMQRCMSNSSLRSRGDRVQRRMLLR